MTMDLKWKTVMTIFIIHGLLVTPARSDVERVTGCQEEGTNLIMRIECNYPGKIKIYKGFWVRVPSCDAYNSSLESQCIMGDRTAQLATYCEQYSSCTSSFAYTAHSGCLGDYTYIYIDYECISDGTAEATNGPTSEAPVSGIADKTTKATRRTTSQAPVSDPVLLQTDVVRQRASLFRQIQGWRLRNHVIKTKHDLSLVKCGAECNKRDDCVSFNISNGVCELNNQVVGGTGVDEDDFVEDEGFEYYEKQ